MPLSDAKKTQHAINVMADEAEIVRAAVARMNGIVTRLQAVNPDVTGTYLQGRKAAILALVTALDTEISQAAWTGLIAASGRDTAGAKALP